MAEFTFHGTRVRIYFSFLFTAALMTLLSGETAAAALAACILHELGHMAAMSCFGMKIQTLSFYGAGVKITLRKGRIYPLYCEAVVLAAGCAVNLLLYIIFGNTVFGLINLFLGIFNLLPAGSLDGGRLLRLWADMLPWNSRSKLNICRFTGCLTAVMLPAAAFCMGIHNVTVFGAAAFMLITALTE